MPDTRQSIDAATIPVHAAIARALRDLGVETMFGLMGDSNLFMVDGYVRNEGGRYVAATHEAAAVMMALGHAMMTGGVGVATITQGPALSNAITPLIDGTKGMVPMVLLSGDTPMRDPDHPQTVSQRALIEASGAGYARFRAAETVVADMAAAFRRAKVERRPIVLCMPTEMMWETVPYAAPSLPPASTAQAPVEGTALEEAVGMIASARRPVVLAGRGAIAARDVLVTLADRIGAPLATSLKAKGLFQGEPYNLGVFGTLSTPAAGDAIAQSDCVVAFGAGLNRFTTAKGGYVEGKRVIHINDDARQLGRLTPADVLIEGDCGLVAEKILEWLDEAEIPSSQATDTLDPEALAARVPTPKVHVKEGTLDYAAAVERINAALDPERVFVSDGGRFLQEAWSRFDVSHPRNMLMSVNLGAIGLGTGYAIGAAVARPDQTVLLVTGDGGFMMGGFTEFSTAVREKLNLVVLVCNDACYGAEYVQFEDRQMDPSMSLFEWPSFAKTAEAMGARGICVTSDAELEAALVELDAPRDGPLLIELMLDPAAVPRLHL